MVLFKSLCPCKHAANCKEYPCAMWTHSHHPWENVHTFQQYNDTIGFHWPIQYHFCYFFGMKSEQEHESPFYYDISKQETNGHGQDSNHPSLTHHSPITHPLLTHYSLITHPSPTHQQPITHTSLTHHSSITHLSLTHHSPITHPSLITHPCTVNSDDHPTY